MKIPNRSSSREQHRVWELKNWPFQSFEKNVKENCLYNFFVFLTPTHLLCNFNPFLTSVPVSGVIWLFVYLYFDVYNNRHEGNGFIIEMSLPAIKMSYWFMLYFIVLKISHLVICTKIN